MRLIHTVAELLAWRQEQTTGLLHFVPTMGALHPGHQSLIERASIPCAGTQPLVLVSVFVNPLQFGPGEDFHRYPRALPQDATLASSAGAHALFAPTAQDLFKGGEAWITRIQPPSALGTALCGHSRPGHFEGVATIVCRLLALIRPGRLFLGEKDWQQLVILRRILGDLAFPVQIEGCATVREGDGLACSSRNRYLSSEQRAQAARLPCALVAARERHRQQPQSIQADSMVATVVEDCQAAGLNVEYVQLVDAHTLQPRQRVEGLTLLAAAVHCGSTRLIDHVFLMLRSPIVAIDGPAGAGKSTVTRCFAERVGLLYLDTGAMYRAVTWWVHDQGVDPSDAPVISDLLNGLNLQLSQAAGEGQVVRINGKDVSAAIRSPEITALVSTVAAHRCVREALTQQQQLMGRQGGLVAEGRDIGTAVFPEADCKVFLTATVAERARRRAEDLRSKGFLVPSLAELEDQISDRDQQDSTREVAPLRQAEDAVELVTDGMTIAEVVQAMVDLFRASVPEDAWPDPVSSEVGSVRSGGC